MTELADRLALGDLVAQYATAVDSRDGDGLLALFAPGAVVVIPEALAGPDGNTRIAPADLLASTARFERTRHVIYQQLVAVAGDTARAETYGQAHHIYRRGEQLHDSAIALRYRDEFVRTQDGWCFSGRELIVDWLTDQPVSRPASRRAPAADQPS
jgi:hypothetical protein